MQELIDYLQDIADGQTPMHARLGLCDNIYFKFSQEEFDRAKAAMKIVCKTWEHYSGDITYPIKGIKNKSAYDSFYSDYGKYTGEYGRRRRELAGLVAEELRKCKS